MEPTSIITILTALVAALGFKEIWNIELKVKIGELELKIDDLIEKNKQCAIKLARLEERMTLSAKKNAGRKQKKIENGTKK